MIQRVFYRMLTIDEEKPYNYLYIWKKSCYFAIRTKKRLDGKE